MKRNMLALLALLIVVPVHAAETKKTAAKKASTTAPAAVPKVEFEKYTLPNGMDVILHVDRKLPIVHVNQWFHV